MRQKFHPNPLWVRPHDPVSVHQFLVDAQHYYQAKKWSHSPDNVVCANKIDYRTLAWLYRLGQDHLIIRFPFKLFCHLVLHAYLRNPYDPCAPHPRYRPWYLRSIDRGYRIRHHHVTSPKIWTEKEIRQKEWREKKKFKKDKSKGKGWCRQGQKTWAKRISNKKERQHVRHCLHHGKEIKPHRLFQDKWMWD